MSTAQQVAANQANAQLSPGPRTEEGKKRWSLNVLKPGLTGRTVGNAESVINERTWGAVVECFLVQAI